MMAFFHHRSLVRAVLTAIDSFSGNVQSLPLEPLRSAGTLTAVRSASIELEHVSAGSLWPMERS
jgi:hypothetical protein